LEAGLDSSYYGTVTRSVAIKAVKVNEECSRRERGLDQRVEEEEEEEVKNPS